jgi:hypothetical protein
MTYSDETDIAWLVADLRSRTSMLADDGLVMTPYCLSREQTIPLVSSSVAGRQRVPSLKSSQTYSLFFNGSDENTRREEFAASENVELSAASALEAILSVAMFSSGGANKKC